jgi:hypothetical protein
MHSVQSDESEKAYYEKLQDVLKSTQTKVVARITMKKQDATAVSNKGRLPGFRKRLD